MSESAPAEMSRLRWLCRRGMKELDVVMSAYLDNHYAGATAEQLYFPGAIADEIYTPGAAESQIGC